MSEQQQLPAAPKPKSKQVILKDYLQRDTVRASIQAVLPKHMTADRLLRIAMQAASRNPVLFECTPESLALSLANAAQLGLEAGGLLGSAYLVPFRNKQGHYEAQLIPGYRGFIELAVKSGAVLKVDVGVHYSDDVHWKWDQGQQILEHVPGDGDGDIKHVYAIATLANGCRKIEVMTKKAIDKIRDSSRAKDSGPWVSFYEAMCKKTVIRQLFKLIPNCDAVNRATEIEANAESGGSIRDINELPALDALPESTETQPEPTTPAEKAKAKLRKGSMNHMAQEADKKTRADTGDAGPMNPMAPPDPDAPDACLEEPTQ